MKNTEQKIKFLKHIELEPQVDKCMCPDQPSIVDIPEQVHVLHFSVNNQHICIQSFTGVN